MTGNRQRRERREALRAALEAEYPGISTVSRPGGEPYDVPADPWSEAAELGFTTLPASLEKT